MARPHITLNQIKERAAPKTYSRGENLYLNKAISETALRGNMIEGTCEAESQPAPYQVQATFDNQGIADTSCNCLYDFGGDCKHVVALLLTYLNNPARFVERAPVEDILESRDKAELITLIRQMVKRHPDLKMLIDRPVPGKAKADKSLDTKVFRKEMRQALGKQREWGGPGAEGAVESIAEAAAAFEEAGDWRSASQIYRMIIEECLAHKDYFYEDEEGWYGAAIDDVLIALGLCLQQLVNDDTERKTILNSLMDFYLADIDSGGDVGADIPETILNFIRSDDIAPIRKRVVEMRDEISDNEYSEWSVESYTEFINELDLLDNVDPEIILKRLRDEEMYSLLVTKLLELNRSAEAIEVIRTDITTPDERLQLFPRLIIAGFTDAAIQLAEETLKSGYNRMLMEWLIFNLQAREDHEKAFHWQLELMKAEPDIAHYNELKRASSRLGNWETVQPAIIAQLEKAKQFATLTRVYLAEEDGDKAWSTLAKVSKSSDRMMGYSHYGLEMDVAKRTIKTYPEKALPVYIKAVNEAIDQRTREKYQQAANYLTVIRDTYDSIDEFEKWEALIAKIRNQQPRLPALLDELKKAGL